MSTVNTLYLHNTDVSESKIFQAHNTAVSLVGNREDDEKKHNTLENDVVTLSEGTQSSNNENLFSHNRSKALMAYKQFGSISMEDAAKNVMQSMETSTATAEADTESEDESTDKVTDENKLPEKPDDDKKKDKKVGEENDKKPNGEELTDEEQAELQKLKDRDQEVRTHEKAHQSAGGQYASAPVYDYQKGPDGKDYAVGGHVNIDTSEESDPDKTIEKMRIVIKAAKAPAQPSGQDLKVAAEAQQTINDAQREKAKELQEEKQEKENPEENEDKVNEIEVDTETNSSSSSKPTSSLSESA